jgi:hypothetical protein
VTGPLLNASWSSEPAEAPGRGDDGTSKEARARKTGGRTESDRVDEMIGALVEAVHAPGEVPSEAALDPSPSRIDDRVETPRRVEPTAEPTRRELALYLVAVVAFGLIAIAVGIAVGILSGRLLFH